MPRSTSRTLEQVGLPGASRRVPIVSPLGWVILVALLLVPWVTNPFLTVQIGGQAMILGLIALSLNFLAGYGGMVSMSQMSIAGLAAYGVGLFGISTGTQSFGWPWWLAVPVAIVTATGIAGLIGAMSARTQSIYTIMITLAAGVFIYFLALQNLSIFNGFQGLSNIHAPTVFDISWRAPAPFYYLCLLAALAGYWFVLRVTATPFGLTLQSIRDNPRRVAALGYNVMAHRIAAHLLAGLLAATAGVLLAWYNTFVAPGTIGVHTLINILIISVIGGLMHPAGAFIGALLFVLLEAFAIDLVGSQRFRLLVGLIFLLVVTLSPNGLLGMLGYVRRHLTDRVLAMRGSRSDQ